MFSAALCSRWTVLVGWNLELRVMKACWLIRTSDCLQILFVHWKKNWAISRHYAWKRWYVGLLLQNILHFQRILHEQAYEFFAGEPGCRTCYNSIQPTSRLFGVDEQLTFDETVVFFLGKPTIGVEDIFLPLRLHRNVQPFQKPRRTQPTCRLPHGCGIKVVRKVSKAWVMGATRGVLELPFPWRAMCTVSKVPCP